jgi:hypothetical protein
MKRWPFESEYCALSNGSIFARFGPGVVKTHRSMADLTRTWTILLYTLTQFK